MSAKKLLKRRKKKSKKRRTKYLDEAPLQIQKSAVYIIRRTEEVKGVDSNGHGEVRLYVLSADLKLSDVVWTIKRSLGEAAKFEIEHIGSGNFVGKPGCLYGFFNADARIFNQDLEIVGRRDYHGRRNKRNSG